MFTQSGLQSDFELTDAEESVTEHGTAINNFLQGLAQRARAAARHSGLESQIQLLRLRMQGLRFLWEGCGADERGRLEVLKRFQAVLDAASWMKQLPASPMGKEGTEDIFG